jgi:PAN domain-containing protein
MKRINPAVGFLIFVILLLVINFNFNFNAYGYDLFGNDIGAVPAANADACAAACNANSNCVAWTWVRAGLKGPGAVCFLKNPAPAPSFNSVCKTNVDCLSGLKRSDGWCGESPNRNAPGSTSVLGQGQVLSCPSGKSCGPKVSQTCTGWWIFKSCTKTQTVDFFCQP